MDLPIRRILPLAATAGALLLVGVLLPATARPAAAAAAPPELSAEADQAASDGSRPCRDEWTAARDGSVAHLRELGDCEIGRRLDTLDKLEGRVSASAAVGASDRAALLAGYGADRRGLVALRTTIDAGQEASALRADLRSVATDFRIYLLVVPKTREVVAADKELAAVGRLDALATRLKGRVEAAKAAGKDMATAQGHFDGMTAAATKVGPLVKGIPAAVLPLTAAQYNAGTAKPILEEARDAIVNARSILAGARAEATACIAALRALR